VLSLGCHVHGIDHVTDEEQAPASWTLLTLEFAGEIRDFGLALRPAFVFPAAMVGDRDDDLGTRLEDLDADGKVRAAAIPVLYGVHRRLRDCGLEPVQPVRRQVQVRDTGSDLVQRDAFIARHTRQRK
jgi:hypothetical protein